MCVLAIGWLALPSGLPAGQPMRHPRCKLIPLRTGVCRLGKDHLLGEDHRADQRMPFVIYAFLVEGPNGERALVDLGPKTVAYLNRMFRAYGFFRDLGPKYRAENRYPDDIVQPEGNVLRQLARRSISPKMIDHVVFTHLHSDHHGMDDARGGGAAEDFPAATLHVSAVGWKDNLDKRKDGRWNSYVDYAFADFLLKREKQGKVRFADNAEIFPGMRTMYLGGHSVCSQAVIVETADGLAILASDDVYLYELLAGDVLPRIRTSEAKYRRAVDRLVDLAVNEKGIIVPLHDPIVWATYNKAGPNWLKELKKVSDRAIEGYLKARRARGK
jgi:glyoxylase-like metal-dependent hydrolase (beta-lactamase superfamily II)